MSFRNRRDTYTLKRIDAEWTKYRAADQAEKAALDSHGRDSAQFREARANLRRISERIDLLEGCGYTRVRLAERDGVYCPL